MAPGRTERASFALSVFGHLLVLAAVLWLGTGSVKGSGGTVMVALVEGRGGGHMEAVRPEASRPSPEPSPLQKVNEQEEASGPAPDEDKVASVSLHEDGEPGPALYGDEEGRVMGIIVGIRETIQGAVRYPPVARRRGYEGTVVASFAVDMGGMPRDIRLIESSGYGVLDREVLRVIERASPYPSVHREVEVPVTFRLR